MNEETIFAEASAIEPGEERKRFVEAACGDNLELRHAVQKLLDLADQAGSFLEHPALADQVGNLDTLRATILQGNGSTCDDDNPASAVNKPGMRNASMDSQHELPPGYLGPATRDDAIGRLGHYEVLQVIGRGAFGTVLRAFDEKLERIVAIKVLAPEMATTSPARKRFLREARTSAAIRHENVVGIHAVEDDPIPYLVMEYIPGQTLQQRLDEQGPLDLLAVLRLGRQIADGLSAAHEQGLIHRDIKPGNILLEGGVEERVKITDFGLARTADDASMTQSGMIAGTPMYMAPEQARGEPLDHRADLFSLGSVLYQMASGRPPFRAAHTVAVLKRVCEDTPRPLSDVIPETPDWLSTIIFRLLEKRREDRYQTAREVAALLAQCQSELRIKGKVTCVPGHAATAVAAMPDPLHAAGKKRATAWLPWLAGTGLTALAALSLTMMKSGVDPTSAPGAPPLSSSRLLPAEIDSQSPTVIPSSSLQFDGIDDYVECLNLPYPTGEPVKVFLSATLGEIPPEVVKEDYLLNWGMGLNLLIVRGRFPTPILDVCFHSGDQFHQFAFDNTLVVGKKFDLTIEHRDGRVNVEFNGRAIPESALRYRLLDGERIVIDSPAERFQPIGLSPDCFIGINTSQVPARNDAGFRGTIHRVKLTKGDGEVVADFDFAHDTGDTLRDLSGNGHDGRIMGARWVSSSSP